MRFETIQVSGKDALKTLDELRANYAHSRRYPFLIGDDDDLEILEENGEEESDTADIVAHSCGISIQTFIERLEKQSKKNECAPVVGVWPTGQIAPMGLTIPTDVQTGKPKPRVHIGLADIDESWALPAAVGFGNWNACPEPAVHCAFLREWQKTYGAEIAGISGSVIECFVSKPPRIRVDAMQLAWQQYWYCADIVDQGCESISNLAATLLGSPIWFFWWD